jgi:CBS domain-containing protein
MTVGEVMHAGIISCRPETTLRTVAGILAAHRIHAVVVAAADADAGWSVVSDRDVVRSHSRGELDQVTAGEAASEPTLSVREDADLQHAAELMDHYGTSHLIVTASGGGRPTGVLSSLDLAAAVARA